MSQDPGHRRYTSPRRDRAAADTRNAILDAARDLFSRDGYTGTSAAAVAERAGVALKTVYASVGNKPDLVDALVDRDLGGPLDRWSDAPEPPTELDATEFLRRLVARFRAVFEQSLIVITIMLEAARADRALAEKGRQVTHRFDAVLETTARRLADRSLLSPAVDERTAVAVLRFYLRPQSWDDLRASGWEWDQIEAWLSRQVVSAVTGAAEPGGRAG